MSIGRVYLSELSLFALLQSFLEIEARKANRRPRQAFDFDDSDRSETEEFT